MYKVVDALRPGKRPACLGANKGILWDIGLYLGDVFARIFIEVFVFTGEEYVQNKIFVLNIE